MADPWDPATYDRFADQRRRPALDLLDRVPAAPGGRVVDLGCGDGWCAPLLRERTGAAEVVGIDSSTRMLEGSRRHVGPGIRFEEGDLADLAGEWDVVFANASLQWVPDHRSLLPRLVERLRPGGTLAFQVPANYGHPSHVVADEVGRRFGLEPLDREAGALDPAAYAEVMHAAGIAEPDVVLRIYGHAMARTDQVLDWVSGTLLTSFERRLGPDRFPAFRDEYRRELLERLGDPAGERPYYYAFARILASGRRT
ncbi:MAG: methyltransferase domain-containing protein [Acidimicrobiia bacterium]